jgi:hypothetical protein
VQFPSTLELSRLNFYAPYVKRLEIPFAIDVDDYHNWGRFLECTRRINLLPNLEHLGVTFPPEHDARKPIGTNLVNWITAFLSTSLLSINISPPLPSSTSHNALINWKLAQCLLQDISEKCSRLNSLTLLPGVATIKTSMYMGDSGVFERSQSIINVSFLNLFPEIHSNIPCFSSLRTLTTTPFILESEAFMALAQLPLLESLSIHSLKEDRQEYDSGLELPDKSFPALRHLELRNVSWKTVFDLFSMKPVIRGLQSALFTVYGGSMDIVYYDGLSDLLSNLVNCNSSIASLSMCTDMDKWRITPQVIESLRRMPLVNLSLDRIEFDDFNWTGFVRALPALEKLCLTSHITALSLKQLRPIATLLPQLRHLVAYIDFKSVVDLMEEDFNLPNPQSQNQICLETFFDGYEHLRTSPQPEDVEKIARSDIHL